MLPLGKWEFDEEVTASFSDMLNRSIPNYDYMRKLVFDLGSLYITPESNVVDIGCSTGLASEPFINKFTNNKYNLLDVSPAMLKKCLDKFRGNDSVTVKFQDVTRGFDYKNTSLILSILSIQFTPIEYRQQIIKDIYNSLNNGGAFIFVEKVLGNGFDIDNAFVQEYYRLKINNDYTRVQINAKKKSLEGVLVPLTADWNVDLLRNAGFKKIDCFWRYLNFSGWIAIK